MPDKSTFTASAQTASAQTASVQTAHADSPQPAQAGLDQVQGPAMAPSQIKIDQLLQQLCTAFNHCPFLQHLHMNMVLEHQHIKCVVNMADHLIGNAAFQILHGGVAATLLDSIGGIVAMAELYQRSDAAQLADTFKKITRLATIDMRVDYIAPGRGKQFIGSAEVLKMGRKGCTVRMAMHNEEGKLIATGIASYAF